MINKRVNTKVWQTGAVVLTAKHSGCVSFTVFNHKQFNLAIVATVLVVDAEIRVFTRLKPKGMKMNSKFIHHDSSFQNRVKKTISGNCGNKWF